MAEIVNENKQKNSATSLPALLLFAVIRVCALISKKSINIDVDAPNFNFRLTI